MLRPDGARGIYGVVVPEDNAATVAIDDKGRIALVSEFLYPLAVVSLQVPSGGIKAGETSRQAAERELLEETGLSASRWQPLGSCYLSGGISTQVSYLFLARDLTEGEARPEGTERLVLTWVDFARAVELVHEGVIQDAPTIAAICKAARYVSVPDRP